MVRLYKNDFVYELISTRITGSSQLFLQLHFIKE